MTGGTPIRPVEAATVVLVREPDVGGRPWECFMVRRHVRSDFAADVFVFPGGKVDEGDQDSGLEQHVQRHEDGKVPGASDPAWRSAALAGLRELFEEAGVLLAYRTDGSMVRFEGESEERFSVHRKRLQRGEISLLDLADKEQLRYAADHLHPFSHWITPEPFARRFDTRFFVAGLPDGQRPLHDAIETTASVWIAPKEALERYRRGDFPLVFATQKQLERMSRYPSIDDMICDVSCEDLEPVMPRMVGAESERRFLLPGDEGY